ncbi:chloride channel protein [Oscillatoria sp. FACHB-1407]|uniref:chloride channel protein n=1 Tax=Oscillatoria sp. FACHB-1407 TaxID=2692847 RepID=UPI001685C873|nr:chloride channel protein [Oscillatoria sp. FACHB-1407]MBD2464827.1 chloride channel protein [Oscillatoria sp. FACHB-1407]
MTQTPDLKGLSQLPIAPTPTTPTPTSSTSTDSASAPTISRLTRILNRLQPNPETVVLLLAILIGTGAGSGVVIFRFLIHWIHRFMLEEVSGFLSVWGHWTLALIPLLGGLMVGLMRWQLKDFGPGLAALMEMVQGGRELLPLKPISKMVAAAISLGSGASLGPEGPSVEIGANFSLLLGQVLRVSQQRQQLLLSAGAAAGLAAGFNAPIAGVFFALEVVLGTTFATSAVSVVLLAAVVAAWIAQIGLGFQPAFSLPAYEVRSLLELPLYIGLGLAASLISVLYKKLMSVSQQSFQGQVAGLRWLATIPLPFHPVLGGAIVGIVALYFPQILGVGYETVEAMLQDVQFSLLLVVSLLVIKLAMTALSFGSGFVGGVFAPALFLGASLGSAYAKILAIAFPSLHPYMASPPAYAMVGMAAVLAGSVRAPLTAILLLFELTQDYRIVLPLMAAVGLSIWLVERLQPTVVLDSDGEQQEPKAETTTATECLLPLRVVEAMQPIPLVLSGDVTLEEAGRSLVEHRSHCALVLGEGQQLLGILTLHDFNRLMTRPKTEVDVWNIAHKPIGQLCTTDVLHAYKDELLSEAIARMAARGLHQLPVVDREHPDQVIGLLTDQDITLAQNIARTEEVLQTAAKTHLLETNGKTLEASSTDDELTPVSDRP